MAGEIFPPLCQPSLPRPAARVRHDPGSGAAPHCRGWPLPCAPVARYPRLPVELSARLAVATPAVQER